MEILRHVWSNLDYVDEIVNLCFVVSVNVKLNREECFLNVLKRLTDLPDLIYFLLKISVLKIFFLIISSLSNTFSDVRKDYLLRRFINKITLGEQFYAYF